ncbi:hypothetical protein [Marmoricola sp. RAF53]|uniref:hypothetical protein n=1 Tax=Marmoricola sp. RAF53 TaxID=3233059 RepID=UPI003F9949CC
MTRRTWIGSLVLAVLTLVVGAGPATAADHLQLSPDGSTWGSALPGPLFDPAFHWVPGDTEAASFYVRNSGTETGSLDVRMRTGAVTDLLDSGDLAVAAQLDGGPFVAVTPGTQPLVTQLTVPAGGVHKVTVRVAFDPTSTDETEDLRLSGLAFDVTLSQDSTVLAPSPEDTGTGGTETAGPHAAAGDLPGTGTVVTPLMLALAAALCAGGVALVGLARRRKDSPDERPSHVPA